MFTKYIIHSHFDKYDGFILPSASFLAKSGTPVNLVNILQGSYLEEMSAHKVWAMKITHSAGNHINMRYCIPIAMSSNCSSRLWTDSTAWKWIGITACQLYNYNKCAILVYAPHSLSACVYLYKFLLYSWQP